MSVINLNYFEFFIKKNKQDEKSLEDKKKPNDKEDEDEEEYEEEPNSTLFVKNLNFDTEEASLQKVMCKIFVQIKIVNISVLINK